MTISRRLLLLTLALAACVPRADSRGSGGGVMVIAATGDADNLFPPTAGNTVARQVTDRIFPRLAELGPSLNTLDDSGFAPSLAARWEHRDPVTLVFHLDPRARWQDGVPVRAEDVAWTFAIYRDTTAGSFYSSNLTAIASVTAEDSLTAVFTFRRAYPEELYDATYHMRVLPKHLLEKIKPDSLSSSAFSRAPVGVGPYRFVRWTAGTIELAADTAYFLGRPGLDRLVWRTMPDLSAAVSALIAGEADAMEAIPVREELARAARDTNLALVPYPSPFLMFVVFNTRRPPFSDRNLRRAVAMTVDRLTMARSVFGPDADVPVGATTKMQWIADGPVAQLPHDTLQAARLLDSLGWRRGVNGMRARAGRPLRFTLVTPSVSRVRQQGAVLLQEQLRRAGIDMQIQAVDFPVLQQRAQAGSFDAAFWSSTLDASPSALVGDWTSASIGQGGNFGAWRSAAFDSLVAAAVATPGRDRAGPLYREALGRLNDDAAALFLFSPRNTAVVHRRYRNVTVRPDSWLATVASWSVPKDRLLPRDRIAAGR